MSETTKKQSADALAGMTVLVVDDSEAAATIICDALHDQGYNLTSVGCGQEAFDWLQLVKPDLLLLDYKLPDFNGNILIERLTEQGREIPFIIITGHGDEKIAVEMMHLGAIDYLVKDETFMEMLPVVVEQTLELLCNQRRLISVEEELQIAEQELTLKESRYSELFSHMSSGVTIYEAVDNGNDFVFVDLNPAAEQIGHVVRDELVGHRLRKIFPAAEEIGLISALRRVWQSGEEQKLPPTSYLDGRTEGWLEHHIYRLSTGEVVAICDDLAEKNRAEREALENRRQAETLIANIPGMVYRCSINRFRTMDFVSDGCRDLLGYSPEDLIGESTLVYADLIHPDDRSMASQQVQEAVEEKLPFVCEYRILSLDGQYLWVRERGRGVYRPDGKLEALEGLIVDITIQKKLLEEHARSAQLAALGTVAAGVAHEVNNPINGIINYAALLIAKPDDHNFVSDIAQRIAKESERIAKITKDLLHYSKDNREELKFVNMKELIEGALSLIVPKILPSGIIVETELTDDSPILKVNPQGIQQIIINLVDNAYDALRYKETSKEDKAIRVNSYLIYAYGQEQFYIEVSDNGIGMSADVIKKARDAFFSTKPSTEGTGLGLSIVSEIVAKHHGEIEIESEEGEYSKFKVCLPVKSTVS